MSKSSLRKLVITIIILVLLGIGLAIVAKSHLKQSPALAINTQDQPTRGNPDAKVHIVVFEDLKCIACKNFNNSVLPRVKSDFIEPGIAKYTVINLAFIPGSMPAANAARCLYVQKPDWFFTFVDNVYQNQPPENQDWATIPKLMEFANIIPGVDTAKLSRCIYDSPYNGFIQNNFKMARELQNGTVSTPAVYVNGRYIENPTFANMQKAVNAAK